MSAAPKLIFNPRALRPAKRVALGTREPYGGVEVSLTAAYWRGFADGARELGDVHWLESEINDYYKRTKGF